MSEPGRSAPPLRADELERFRVRARAEIVGILRDLMHQNSLITVYFGPLQEFFVTALLAIDSDTSTLVFDSGADARLNARLPKTPAARLETFVDHIRMEFSIGSIAAVDFDGKPAFRAPLPPSLLRIQRRETYRAHVPRSRSIICELPPANDSGQPVLAHVRDISIGGVALVDFPAALVLLPGTVFDHCALRLSNADAIETGIELVHIYRPQAAVPGRGQLVGCRFLRLNTQAEAKIQRLINQLDRERLD